VAPEPEPVAAAGEVSVEESGAQHSPRTPVHLSGRRARRRLPNGVAPGLGLGSWQWRWWWWGGAAAGRVGSVVGHASAACGRRGGQLGHEALPVLELGELTLLDSPSEVNGSYGHLEGGGE
jgi:hypothetical protein